MNNIYSLFNFGRTRIYHTQYSFCESISDHSSRPLESIKNWNSVPLQEIMLYGIHLIPFHRIPTATLLNTYRMSTSQTYWVQKYQACATRRLIEGYCRYSLELIKINKFNLLMLINRGTKAIRQGISNWSYNFSFIDFYSSI